MAITRVWQSGAESGVNEFDTILTDITVVSGSSNTGDYMYRPSWSNIYSSQSIPNTRQIRIGYFMNPNSDLNYDHLQVRAVTTSLVAINITSSVMSLKIAGVSQDTTERFQASTWQHIGLDVKIDSSSGWAKVYVDGSEVMSFSGNTGNSDITNVMMGEISGTGGRYIRLDDIYIDDTTGEGTPTGPLIKRFYSINVNGDGTYSQWTPSTGSSHYQMVDERPPDDDTTYLEAVTGSLLDSFDMTTFTLDTNENIVAMIPFAIAKRGSTTEKLSLGTRSSGTNLIGTAQDLSTSYDYYWERQITGSLGFEWTQDYLDSVEVIINSTGTY